MGTPASQNAYLLIRQAHATAQDAASVNRVPKAAQPMVSKTTHSTLLHRRGTGI